MSQSGLIQQGYNCYTKDELKNISNGLRFTPLLCMFLALYALYTHNATMHFAIAALGIIPFWFPNHHPFDVFYNKIFRHAVGGASLPSNPLPRRIACMMGGLMNIAIGLSFLYGNVTLAYVFGAVLIALQLIVITTHFCVASWMYEMAMRLAGRWEDFISVDKAKSLMSTGALLVDVRSPDEFEKEHIDGAINIPIENIGSDERLIDKTAILYCNSGMRCAEGRKILESKGRSKVFNFGRLNRWK